MILYGDTVLIPDPILPWIESPRGEERNRSLPILEAAFYLLHLAAFFNTDQPILPVVVFPSFEKSLEERDPVTQARMDSFGARVISHYLGKRFDTLKSLQDYAKENEPQFLAAVDTQHLFVAPDGPVGQPLAEALKKYKQEIKHRRSKSYLNVANQMPRGVFTLWAVLERLLPHYHLIQNAKELQACPLITLSTQWHYYELVSSFFSTQLTQNGGSPRYETWTISPSPSSQDWLGAVPTAQLVEMISNHENENFRHHLVGPFPAYSAIFVGLALPC